MKWISCNEWYCWNAVNATKPELADTFVEQHTEVPDEIATRLEQAVVELRKCQELIEPYQRV